MKIQHNATMQYKYNNTVRIQQYSENKWWYRPKETIVLEIRDTNRDISE